MLNKLKDKFKKKESTKPKRELTSKEKLLGTLLILGVVGYVLYNYVFLAQTNKINLLNETRYETQQEYDVINRLAQNDVRTKEELTELTSKKSVMLGGYFTELYQPYIIQVVNKLTEHEEFTVDDISFNDGSREMIGETELFTLSTSIQYTGSYNGITHVIKQFLEYSQHIGITDIEILRGDNDSGEELSEEETAEGSKLIKDSLNGEITIKLIGLTGLVESESPSYNIENLMPSEGVNPFSVIDAEKIEEEDEDKKDGSGGDSEEDHNVDKRKFVMLNDFEDSQFQMVNTSDMSKGRIVRSTTRKSGKYSMKMEYNMVAIDPINRIYADMANKNIVLKYPPSSLGMWIHSYGYSPATVGLRLTGQAGEIVDLEVTKGMGFVGWEYIEVTPPKDVSIYPLKVEKVYMEMPFDREDLGVVIIDKLEAIYPPTEKTDTSVPSSRTYVYHVVKSESENLSGIVKAFYGSTSRLSSVGAINDIYDYNKALEEGQIVILPRN